MPNATGPWCHPPELPADPKKLHLVLLEDRKSERGFHVNVLSAQQLAVSGRIGLEQQPKSDLLGGDQGRSTRASSAGKRGDLSC